MSQRSKIDVTIIIINSLKIKEKGFHSGYISVAKSFFIPLTLGYGFRITHTQVFFQVYDHDFQFWVID